MPADERARDILEATLRLVAAGGVDAIRYREVAAEAGVPLGTVSYHYDSREALLRAAFTHFLEENTRALRSLRARFAGRRLEEVPRYFVELARADLADPRRRVVAEYELIVYAARDAEVARALERWERAMIGELAQALEGLGVTGPAAAARTLHEIFRGFQLVHLGRGDADLADLRRRLTAVVRALASSETKGTRHASRHPAR
jgi:DNA-binding transcriptional regulator YbjK